MLSPKLFTVSLATMSGCKCLEILGERGELCQLSSCTDMSVDRTGQDVTSFSFSGSRGVPQTDLLRP